MIILLLICETILPDWKTPLGITFDTSCSQEFNKKKGSFWEKKSIYPKKIEICQFFDDYFFRWAAGALNSFEIAFLGMFNLEFVF